MNIEVSHDIKEFHLGKLFLENVRKNLDNVCQIDGYIGREEGNGSVLERTIRLASSYRSYGLKPGDVVAISGFNHLDLQIPHYAALVEGLPVTFVDPTFNYDELMALFTVTSPKIIFCEKKNMEMMQKVNSELSGKNKMITFNGDYTMESFIKENLKEPVNFEEYEPMEIDTDKHNAWIVSTSGSTGAPKIVAYTHKNITETIYFLHVAFKTPNDTVALNLSSPQWASSYFSAVMSPIHSTTNLQSSGPNTVEHIAEVINKFRPTSTMFSPIMLNKILKYQGSCELKYFKSISVGGSKVYKDALIELKAKTDATINELYGLTEALGPVLFPVPDTPLGSCGKPYNRFQVKLVQPDTEDEILEPNKIGELLIKGPIFTEYYKNAELTAKAFTSDGWFKTDDLLYKDENDFYYFVERRSMVIKSRGTEIYPPELEEVIRKHENVMEVAVVGAVTEDGAEETSAVVVLRPGTEVTSRDIKSLIENKFSEEKRLNGGVAFVEALPMTSTGKVASHRLREQVKILKRD